MNFSNAFYDKTYKPKHHVVTKRSYTLPRKKWDNVLNERRTSNDTHENQTKASRNGTGTSKVGPTSKAQKAQSPLEIL